MQTKYHAKGVKPAAYWVKGEQGCGMCGHVAKTRADMLQHYSSFHNVRIVK